MKAVAAGLEIVCRGGGGVGVQVTAKFFADLVDGVGFLDPLGNVDLQITVTVYLIISAVGARR